MEHQVKLETRSTAEMARTPFMAAAGPTCLLEAQEMIRWTALPVPT
jgi:hypothetical protein